ncbi:MAG: hypothetical protein ACI8W3_002068 [Myxococcota bacterium]
MNWIRNQRLIVVIYACALLLAYFEVNLPPERAGELDSPSAYLKPDVNIADVSASLYPERALTLYYRAYQASLCSGPVRNQPEGCRGRDRVAPGDVRTLIERSLATGNRSIEMAMYNYIHVLIQEGASEDEILAAAHRWRLSYPASAYPNPITARKEQSPDN